MSKDLFTFLRRYPDNLQNATLFARECVLDLLPDSFELIYNDDTGLDVEFSVSAERAQSFCALALHPDEVQMTFNRSSDIPDPEQTFARVGQSDLALTLRSKKDFPSDQVKRLLRQVHWRALNTLQQKKQVNKGFAITKSPAEPRQKPA